MTARLYILPWTWRT